MDAHLIEALRSIVGDAGLVRERARRVAYESDGLASFRVTPGLVVLPASTEEVAACVKLAPAPVAVLHSVAPSRVMLSVA